MDLFENDGKPFVHKDGLNAWKFVTRKTMLPYVIDATQQHNQTVTCLLADRTTDRDTVQDRLTLWQEYHI